jgi:glc operon protein GlcG
MNTDETCVNNVPKAPSPVRDDGSEGRTSMKTSRSYRTAGYVLAALLCATPLRAEAQLTEKTGMTLEAARRCIAAAAAEARRLEAPGAVIAVVDDGGNLVALQRLDGTFAAGANVSIGKARTAALFKKPTKAFEDLINNGRTAMAALPDFTPLQGGVPIERGGEIIGGIGVSGAASAPQDEEIALAGAAVAKTLANGVPAAAAAVSHFDAAQVSEAFAKGAVLLDGAGRNYMVHASRRDGPGMAEVHLEDTDIIYVLDGTATFVTGGTVAGAKTVEPGEIRGTAIRGGEARHISKGDVLVVPNGTPHWFQQVPGPLTYYVVKVR